MKMKSLLPSLAAPVLMTLMANAEAGGDPYAMKKAVSLPTGIEMQYVEAGNPEGEAVILLHGYTDSSRSFQPTIEALLELDADFHIFAPDLRGHGGSSMPAGDECAAKPGTCFGMADFAADVFAFMDIQGIESAHVAGHSMGTLIAQQMALAHPGRIESLVMIGTAARVEGNPVLAEFILAQTLAGNDSGVDGLWRHALEANPAFGDWPQDAYGLTPRDADPRAEEWMTANWVADATADRAFLRQVVPESAAVRLGTWLGAAEALLQVDHTAALAGLRVDSLVLWATQDVVFPAADQEALRLALGEAAAACGAGYAWKQYGREPLPPAGQTDLGHNTQWGAPGQVAMDIHSWITAGRPTPDLYFADPGDPKLIRTEPGAATVIEVPAATGCTASARPPDP